MLQNTNLKSRPESCPGLTLHTTFSWPSRVNCMIPSCRVYPSIVLSLLPVITRPSGKASQGGNQQTQDTKLL